MGVDDVPMDDKAKRMRDLLSSFYSPDPSSPSKTPNASSRFATLDTINTTTFDVDQYMNLLVQKSNLEGLLQRHVDMAAEIKNLDTDLQMLVYENYNKFVSATDAIKRMKNNIVGMETNMEQLLEKIMSVQSRSDGVNTSLFEKREHIEKLHRTRNLLRKVQFIYDLPATLAKCIKSEAYADAVRYYIGAMPIFKIYGDSSFLDCKRASEEAIAIISKALQGKVFSDSESIQARAEAVMLLKQLDFPVNNLKEQLFEKLEQFLVDLHLEYKEITYASSGLGGIPVTASSSSHEASIREFAEAVRAYRVIFPDSEQQLFRLAKELATKHFEATKQHIKKQVSSTDLVAMLRVIWTDVLLMDEVLPEAGLRDFTFEAAHDAIKQYVACTFSHLLLDISDALVKGHDNQKGFIEEEYPLQSALETSKKALVQGSMGTLLDSRRLLDENLEVLSSLTDLIIEWVQEGFQDFFRKLNDHFFMLSGKKYSANQDLTFGEGMQGDKILPELVLLLAQLSVFIEQNAITRITEEISSFSGGGTRGYENSSAFIPAEICRIFRSAGEELLQHVAVYTCEECGFEIYQEVTARVFMPLFECPSKRCTVNKAKGNLILQLRASKFLKFQEAKIQELAEHVPKGHIPRSMTVHFRGELTRKVSPGDVVELSGIFLPMPYTGFRAMRAGLIADTYLEAMSVSHFKKKYEDYELRGDEEEQIARLAEDGDIYNKLSRSLAPEIFGHEDIKKALLLLLVGAPHRQLKDGMKIRGDLHICLMGDPGVAKSQLLKHIINVAPRGVYTTGKGSSGVGLTAAVQKDPVTNEMVLEGGALVLADMGICAIDEFDKMDDSDRTAIHEVMEQQTVSIAKAGITTSLNARTAVLAAANPAWGRYDMRRTPAENINLPPALLSRFDLLWLILDRADMDSDLELARHVVYVHQNKESPALGFTPLEPSVLRAYISAARRLSPSVPKELEDYIAGAYSSIRQEEAKSNTPHSYTTVRTLLSILRISSALARLRFSEKVAQSDVDEALRLMQMSKFSLYSDDRQRSGLDAISDIYSILRDEAARMNRLELTYAQALNWISRKGYSEAQLKECLEEYAALNVWQIHPDSFNIRFIDA